ncbi:MAG TPA: hypothetical protein VGN07_04125 [Steroidobacteraceae bacterium]|jgi:hypothetical protein
MNIRFSPGAVRCRVNSKELDSLQSGRAITLEVALPRKHAFRANIRPGVVGGWLLDSDPTGLWITIPRTELELLAQSLPSRAGIEHKFDLVDGGTVLVSFEVDVKERRLAVSG